MKREARSFPAARRSSSAAQALHAEIERLKKMTMLERVELALSLRTQHPWLPDATPQLETKADEK